MRLSLTGDALAPSDEELVAAFQAGDASAFDLLVSRWDRKIQGAIYRVVGASEDSRDLCQEVFLKAFRKAGEVRPLGQVYTWLYRIAVNHCLNKLRRRKLVLGASQRRRSGGKKARALGTAGG